MESMEWLFFPLFPGRIGIWECWREENQSTWRKALRARTRTSNKLNLHDAETRNRTQAALVGGECSHHCAIPAPHSSSLCVMLTVIAQHPCHFKVHCICRIVLLIRTQDSLLINICYIFSPHHVVYHTFFFSRCGQEFKYSSLTTFSKSNLWHGVKVWPVSCL